ncbi:uncharacterized protein TNIN_258681, partial [Trichonephila inaurata madagascariensis]
VLNSKLSQAKHVIHNSKETYILRYFEDQKIIPVTVELDLKLQTERVISFDPNHGWSSVTFYDFPKKKVAYKDADSNQCFVADLHGENLTEDRKRLAEFKCFYIPTLTIRKEITNTSEIHEKFGHHIHLFCNGSDVSFVTRESQLSRKKRATPSNNGEGGQFTHHSYGHYGHQSNNYAHYGHETHITGTVDKDGNLRGQRVSQHETRSQGSQTYPPSGNGRTQQSQSTDSRSSSGGPLQLVPPSLQNNLGTGSGGSLGLSQTGFPSISGEERGIYGVTDQQQRHIDSLGQRGLPPGFRPGIDDLRTGGQRGGQISRDMRPGSSVYVPSTGPGGQPTVDASGRPITGISQPSFPGVPGSLQGGFTPGGQQIHPSLDVSGRPITGISQPSLSRVPGSQPGFTPTGQITYPTLDASGRPITGQLPHSRIPGSLPGFTYPGSVMPGFQNGHRGVPQPGIFDSKNIIGQEIAPDRGAAVDSRMVPQQQRPVSPGYLPGSYPIGPPGSISSRPGVQVDQFGRVIPGTPGSYISPDGRVSEDHLTQTGILPHDIRDSKIPSGRGSVPGYINGRGPGTIGGIPGGDFDTSRGIRRPDGSLISPGTVSGVQPSDGRTGSGSTDTQSYIPGSSLPGFQYPGYLPSGEQRGLQKPGGRLSLELKAYYPLRFNQVVLFDTEVEILHLLKLKFKQVWKEPPQKLLQLVQYKGLGSQTQVQGGYRGNGSFSAQAQSGFTGGVAQSQVQGGKQGGLSGSSAIVEDLGSAQSQVQIGQPSGAASSTAQGRFSRGMTQVQAQSSKSGGSAGAESQSSGLSNSQVQVNIGGEDGQQSKDFQGTVSASVFGGHSSGQSQTQLQGGYGSGRTYVATAQGGFDSNQGFQGAVPASGSLPMLTPPVTDGGVEGQGGRVTTGGRHITSPTSGRYPTDGRHGQVPDSGQPSTFPGSQQPAFGRGIDQSGISGLDQRGLQQPVPSYPGSHDTRYQPGSQLPGYAYPSSQTGLLPPAFDSRHPDSSGRPTTPDSRFHPGQSVLTPSRVSPGQLPQETYQPGYQPGFSQQPSQIMTGVPSSVQISPPHPGTGQPRYQPGQGQPPSQISPGFPSPVQISPPHPGAGQPGYQPGYQPPPQISPGFPSPVQISPPHPGVGQPRYQPGLGQPPSQISTGFPSPVQISPLHPGAGQPGYQPGYQPPSQIFTGFPSSHREAQPGYQPGLIQPPSQISTGFPSSLQISPSQLGVRQPGFQPGLMPGSARIPSTMHVSPPHPEIRQPGYEQGVIPGSARIPSMVPVSPPHPRVQQPPYQPGLLQPPSQTHTGIPSLLPGQQQFPYRPGIPGGVPTIDTSQPVILNTSMPRISTRQPGVREPDLTDEGTCCEALRNLKRRCCDRANGQNGKPDSSCCSKSNKFDNDFDFDDDSDESSNGEPCKVVKAVCYIVYKPVGKARICKPTKTNGC